MADAKEREEDVAPDSEEDRASEEEESEDEEAEAEESRDEESEDEKPKKQSLKERLSDLGGVGIAVYFIIFALTLAGFAVAIAAGFEVESAGEGGGLLFAAWVATKFTQPLRIGATFVLTPIVYKVYYTIRPKKDDPDPEDDRAEAEDAEDEAE